MARFGHGSAKLARQAQSKEKVMGKMIAGGLTEKVLQEKVSGTTTCEALWLRSADNLDDISSDYLENCMAAGSRDG